MTRLTLPEVRAEMGGCPAIETLSIQVVRIADGEQPIVEMSMPLSAASRRARGGDQFHGGAIASLIDTAGDYAVAVAVGGGVPTINMRVDYLRPATGEVLRATARARRIGRTVAVVDVEVADPDGRVCALGRATYATNPG
jgi:uncharacterized protein (TIGR00369 family)